MRIGVSLFLLALGAVLTFALNARTSFMNLDVVGVILMVVGAIGLVATMTVWNRATPLGTTRVERTVVHDRDLPVI